MASDRVETDVPVIVRAPLELGPAELARTADGVEAAASYGDVEIEHRLLLEGCGLLDRLWVEHLELTGEDRGRFLNGMVTGDTRSLGPGDGRFVFLTTVQGRILAEARVMALDDSLLLELPAGRAGPIAEHLSRYVVADRVEVEPRPALRALTVLGPAARAVAGRLVAGAPLPADRWSSLEATWEGASLVLAWEERLGCTALTVHVDGGAAPAVARHLLRDLDGLAARPVGWLAAEARRVETGLARFGPDFGDERFPQEVGESDALDFEKGCYLGQEVVARIHYRGRVNHRLCGLRLAGDGLPTPATPVELDGDEVGRSGTAVSSPALGAAVALAVLHRKAQHGAGVTLAGTDAEVVDLPFVAD